MTQANVKLITFEEYLSYSDETQMEGRYELINGELVELPYSGHAFTPAAC